MTSRTRYTYDPKTREIRTVTPYKNGIKDESFTREGYENGDIKDGD
jgi:hypothetical protein